MKIIERAKNQLLEGVWKGEKPTAFYVHNTSPFISMM
jgi:hypothetical protein